MYDRRPAAGCKVIGRRRTLEGVSAEFDMRELLACLVSRIRADSSYRCINNNIVIPILT